MSEALRSEMWLPVAEVERLKKQDRLATEMRGRLESLAHRKTVWEAAVKDTNQAKHREARAFHDFEAEKEELHKLFQEVKP